MSDTRPHHGPRLIVSLRMHDADPGQSLVMPLDLYERVLLMPIDMPGPNADAFDRMLCTPRAVERLRERGAMVQEISQQLARALVQILSADDTTQGYPR